MCAAVPEKPTLEGLEEKWMARWSEAGTYRFDRTKSRAEIFSIDTPPPTVSGNLHIGHLCSFTQTDVIARFHRMRGREVFYPMGWDDNSLNVERRVQLTYGVVCDPTLPYEGPLYEPPGPSKQPLPVSRPTFVGLCERLTTELEQAYFDLWSRLSLSVDWSQTYTTIGARAQRASQLSFIHLLEKGLAYTAEAPTVWDVDYRTAVAQAELEDRELPGAYHRLRFHGVDGAADIDIETTRPELVPACVALVAHPDDERYEARFGTEVETPLFRVRVPVLAHPLADPEKGSGIAMICTFGDVTDVVWWRELSLPVRGVLGGDGRLKPITWGEPGWESADDAAAQRHYDEIAGKRAKQAQRRIVELLTESGELIGEVKPITHAVKFWENGDTPLEIITNRQWFIRTVEHRDTWLERGRELQWFPDFMRVRYENWVNGLNGDWNISRQRYFGVPFPCWYPVDAEGEVDWDHAIVAAPDTLPVDPSVQCPPGFTEDQRGRPDGFVGDPNVMDTWATSSTSPQIVGGWADDPDLYSRVFPYDLRPQAHDIIRTWLFYTVVRSHFEEGVLPWRDANISGFVQDPDRKKLSKSKGNSPDDPQNVLAESGVDAVRYWACGSKLGMDTNFDRNQIKVGRRLATKLLNASRFGLSLPGAPDQASEVTETIDRDVLARLADVVDEATTAFEAYDYARALERVEGFFWTFCDDYLELVKGRAYAEGVPSASARRALSESLSTLLRLFAPFLPYVTEEVWSWWQDGSVHRASWPAASDLRRLGADTDAGVLAAAAEVLAAIRRAKTGAKLSMRAPVQSAVVTARAEVLRAVEAARSDIRDAGTVDSLELIEADTDLTVSVELAEAG